MSEMKIPCAVAEDLLPLYHDAVCSEESRALVEEHVAQCEKCAALLRELRQEELPQENIIDDTTPLKTIEKEWKKGKWNALYKGIIITSLVVSVIAYGISLVDSFKTKPVPAEALELSQISQLSDGRIIYHLKVTDGKDFYMDRYFSHTPDGDCYITPARSIVEGKRKENGVLFRDFYMADFADLNAERKEEGKPPIKRVFIGSYEDGAILLWEEGMELPAASAELERMVKAGEVTN